jgi:hypothetical protein
MNSLVASCAVCGQTINENAWQQTLQSLEKTSVSSVVRNVFLLDNKSLSDLYFRGFAWGGRRSADAYR